MPGDRFFDTNILIYAFAAGDRRSARAEALMAEGGVIGVQVLNEFTSVVRRKLSWDWPQVDAALSVIFELMGSAHPLTTEIHAHALKLARGSTLSFYDALVIAAAADAGCSVLLTEDLQHGRKFGGVTVQNPFLGET
jgi:predicted nucleic acid-binding protein